MFNSTFKTSSFLSNKIPKATAAISHMMALGTAAAPAQAGWQESWQEWSDWLTVVTDFFEALDEAAGSFDYDDF